MIAFDFITGSSDLILAVNTILYFKSYQKNLVAFKVFSIYLLFYFIIQMITWYLFEQKLDNLFLSHYYFIGSFVFLSIFFSEIFEKQFIKKLIYSIIAINLIILSLHYYFYPESYNKFNTLEVIITSVPLIFYSILFFYQKIIDQKKEYIYIVSGFFLYTLCSTLLFTVGNLPSEIKEIIWYSNAILILVYQILIFIEWYKHFRKKEVSF